MERWTVLQGLRARRREHEAWAEAYTLCILVYGALKARHAHKGRRLAERIAEAVDARTAQHALELGELRTTVGDLGRSFLTGHTLSGAHRGDHDPFPLASPPEGASGALTGWSPDHVTQAHCLHCPYPPDADCKLLCAHVPVFDQGPAQ